MKYVFASSQEQKLLLQSPILPRIFNAWISHLVRKLLGSLAHKIIFLDHL